MAEENKQESKPAATAPVNKRREDFRSVYSNSVYYDPSVYELRASFGEMQRTPQGAFVEYHTAVSMSWLEAKLTAIYLIVNMANYEREHGTVKIPSVVRPAFISEENGNQSLDEILKSLNANFAKYVESLPESEK
jgi:hypothetical protein